ncbi:hypothetical protein BD309DRAFT_413443 [Dichomitus squalens]|nr:hypothetical protein BD309DRAFT_413443 [Dichomitus squalens]
MHQRRALRWTIVYVALSTVHLRDWRRLNRASILSDRTAEKSANTRPRRWGSLSRAYWSIPDTEVRDDMVDEESRRGSRAQASRDRVVFE